ncbi:MAG: glycosyl transferase family 90, partial [Kiritimatiellia bacterium]|nr:glycosyl transferase family 90 [Kiritimatiellia bacterium]
MRFTSQGMLSYQVGHGARLLMPGAVYRRRRMVLESGISDADAAEIAERVFYANRIDKPFALPESAAPFRFDPRGGQSRYQLDLLQFLRYFDRNLRLNYRFGDRIDPLPWPAFTKARPIGAHPWFLLFPLNRIRHFRFVADPIPFAEKKDRLVWRGNTHSEIRRTFLKSYFRHPLCDVGHAHRRNNVSPWRKSFLSVREQLGFKFILSLEGNDVATNLKWILSSNSLCFTPRPTCETWFMEGRLEPNRHYVLLRDDFADLEEKLLHFTNHPAD